ncbi:ABC transporter substrate-binding protein [Paenibacillus dendritiformis C454]|uniref:ABC transporter substrate-binding protein n=2 Tax=Paenibacillus dendritiformis TaxID=130049 RepID=H3SAW7_9BACL|nr:ABC transporter substrate-binding protein [Paenibacillus dendritiformis C454]
MKGAVRTMKKSVSILLIAILMMAALLAGCSGSPAEEPPASSGQAATDDPSSAPAAVEGKEPEPKGGPVKTTEVAYDGEPVTLKFIIAVDDETFRIRFKDQIEATFPNITLELAEASLDAAGLQELNARGDIPDLYVMHSGYQDMKELDMLEPLDPYIERSGFDMSIFREGVVDVIRALDPDGAGALYGMPIEDSRKALFYNKVIFDKFGVDYPKDGMTYDEILDLAQKLTTERDGVKYKGFSFGYYSHAFSQLGVNGTDPQTGEVLFAKEPAFQQFFELLDKYRNIPGMIDTSDYTYSFSNEQNVAMYIGQLQHLPLNNAVEGLDFDIVSVPEWPDHKGIGPTAPAVSVSINKHSRHKEAAWAVIAYLASEAGQMVLSRAGSPPTINSEEAVSEYAAMHIEESGKTYNIAPIFEQKPAPIAVYSPYGPLITFNYDDFINLKAKDFVKMPGKDTATFLREMEEEYAGLVKEMKVKK